MNRISSVFAMFAALALLAFSVPAMATDEHHTTGEKTVTKSITGEVVDMGCYLGHGARGEKHISCATKCLAQGMPMGLLTSNGTLYLVTLDHDNADPYNNLKDMAGKNATVTGELLNRNGVKAIAASKVQLASK
jgi:hypothetical protein